MGKGKYETTVFDRARDELFSHIQRCGVLEADDEHRAEWLKDTTDYLRERYPELNREQLDELSEIGDRYCSPVIEHGDSEEDEDAAAEADDRPSGEADDSKTEAGEETEVSVA